MAEQGGSAAAPSLTLVSGPSGGGKSAWAEHLASGSGREVVYLATGPSLPDDEAWQRRLERHRRRRPPSWICREVEGDLAEGLAGLGREQLGLVDSLGTWVAAHLERSEEDWTACRQECLRALDACPAPLVLVCEEVGWGVVPATALGTRFQDRLTALIQRLAPRSGASWLVVQGRALDLRALGHPVPPA